MAKRHSLIGTGREALEAATGQRGAAGRPTKPRARVRSRPKLQLTPKTLEPSVRPGSSAEEPAKRVSAAKAAPSPALKGAATLYCEMLGFGRERLEQAIEAGRLLGRCRTPAEALETQARLARAATEQAVRESFRLMELAAQGFGESWASMQKGIAGFAARDARPSE